MGGPIGGGAASYFILSFLILAVIQTLFYVVTVAHTIAIAVTRPLFPLHHLPRPPLSRSRLSFRSTESMLSTIPKEVQQWELASYFLLSLLL